MMSDSVLPYTVLALVTGRIQSNITRMRSLQYQLKPSVIASGRRLGIGQAGEQHAQRQPYTQGAKGLR